MRRAAVGPASGDEAQERDEGTAMSSADQDRDERREQLAGRSVAVIGAGLTGASWAGLFASAGLEVRIYDVDATRLPGAVERATNAAFLLARNGLADSIAASRGRSTLAGVASFTEAVDGVTHVQECVREDLELKREVFAALDEAAPADALLCTSSSGLSIGQIQTAVGRPERCLAAHPYNPPHLVPLVELAPGPLTSAEAMTRAADFYTAVGKKPIVLTQDVPGYVANRLSAALWREAIDLVLRGVATVEDVDLAISCGPGLRWAAMGPHLLYDLGGGEQGIRGHIEHLTATKEGMLRDLATWTTFPPETGEALAEGLAREKGGRTYAELTAERDQLLIAYLKAQQQVRED
jgi:carnitine 3-dehydrogenase